jgi:hypothetical protein
MKYYLAHLYGSEPNFENCKFIIYTKIFTSKIKLKNNEILCLHQEVEINENLFNKERINICYEDIEYQYSVY